VDVSLDIAGLEQTIGNIPGGSIVVIKGGPDPVKSYLAQLIAAAAVVNGHSVTYLSSYGGATAKLLFSNYFHDGAGIDFQATNAPEMSYIHIQPDRMLVMDSFSFMVATRSIDGIKDILDKIKARVLETSSNSVMVLTADMLSPQLESMILHYADGFLCLLEKESGEGVKRYIRIPKWMGGRSYDHNIFFNFNDNRLNVDTRYRVV